MKSYLIQKIKPQYRDEITAILNKYWGSPKVVSRGHVFYADQFPGFIAIENRTIIGLITYHIEGDQCEIVTLNSLKEGIGIGSQLIKSVKLVAENRRCCRVWLITTNDNIAAIQFYQKRGFHMVAIYPDAIQKSRRLKPSIPLLGHQGIPIRDEIEFEILLQ
jgi:ribosomal protein S18 acetylase RimI-like enzyme